MTWHIKQLLWRQRLKEILLDDKNARGAWLVFLDKGILAVLYKEGPTRTLKLFF